MSLYIDDIQHACHPPDLPDEVKAGWWNCPECKAGWSYYPVWANSPPTWQRKGRSSRRWRRQAKATIQEQASLRGGQQTPRHAPKPPKVTPPPFEPDRDLITYIEQEQKEPGSSSNE